MEQGPDKHRSVRDSNDTDSISEARSEICNKPMPTNNEDIAEELKQRLTLIEATDASSKASLQRAVMLTDRLIEQLASCPICHETLANPKTTECKHVFCSKCLYNWLRRNRSCPTCREAIPTGSTTEHTAGLVRVSAADRLRRRRVVQRPL